MARKKTISLNRLKEIREIAESIYYEQTTLGEAFPILHFVEKDILRIVPNFQMHVVDDLSEFKKNTAAFVRIENGNIVLRVLLNIYDAARRGDNFSRHTLAHEIGHVLLHREYLPVGRARTTTNLKRDVVEKEADIFAGALQLPIHAIIGVNDVGLLSKRYKVSRTSVDISGKQLRLLYPGPRGF